MSSRPWFPFSSPKRSSAILIVRAVWLVSVAVSACRPSREPRAVQTDSDNRHANVDWAWPGDAQPAPLVRLSLPPDPLASWQTAEGPALIEAGFMEGLIVLTARDELSAITRYDTLREQFATAPAVSFIPLTRGRRWLYERLVYSYWAESLERGPDSNAVGYTLFGRSGFRPDGTWVDGRGWLKVVVSVVPGQNLKYWRYRPARGELRFFTTDGPPPTNWAAMRRSTFTVTLGEPFVVAGQTRFPVITEPAREAGVPPERSWFVIRGPAGVEFWESWLWSYPVTNVTDAENGRAEASYAGPLAAAGAHSEDADLIESRRPILFDAGFSRVRTYRSSSRVNHGYIVEVEPQPVEVPAGSYSGTLRVAEYMEPRGTHASPLRLPERPPEQESDHGWLTMSWYAQDVGLIRQLQYAKNGRLCYETRFIDAASSQAGGHVFH